MPLIDAKEIVYAEIENIGKDRLKMDLIADASASKRYISEILRQCFLNIDEGDYKTQGDVCEALLHFILTALSIPSDRKTAVGRIQLDIVIPSVKELKKDCSKAIVIQFIRRSSDQSLLADAHEVQPDWLKIWAVSTLPLSFRCKAYSVSGIHPSFSSIIVDVQSFLAQKGIRGLKILGG